MSVYSLLPFTYAGCCCCSGSDWAHVSQLSPAAQGARRVVCRSCRPGLRSRCDPGSCCQKICACNQNLNKHTYSKYILLYHDGQTVSFLPGSDQPFTLSSYEDFIGKCYQKLRLFICDMDHFTAGKFIITNCSMFYCWIAIGV